ncbi:MAG: DUF1540 domain-containing protein [Ruminococcaceae bacterium]|nr:DUF1540 domain-containing protein [Oscillospiraceae bacterium]
MRQDERYYSPELLEVETKYPGRLRGVSCDVMSCVYHDGESFCTASHITVGPTSALSAPQTACATYKRKQR